MKQAAKLINPFLLLAIFASLVMLSCSSCGGKSGGAKPADDATFKKSNLPIFPLATGFGAFTFAGSGRNLSSPETTIYRVSTLNASGEGSLNSCVQASGPRVCVFEVSGTIILSDDLTVADPFLTIAGQTAPNPGITIRGGGLRIKTHDVLVQHVSIRVGDSIIGSRPDMRDGVGIVGDAGAFNIVIDHCSISWALDENFDAYYEKAFAITVSNSIISEGLLDSIHKKGPHSMGALIGDGVNDITFYRSLIANNRERNPYLKPGVVVELVNNVFYNWGKGQWQGTDISDYDKTGRDSSIHIVGNYYKPGPETGDTPPLFGQPAPGNNSKLYLVDNVVANKKSLKSDWDLVNNVNEQQFRSLAPVFSSNITNIVPASVAYPTVLSQVGSRPKNRDDVDLRIIDEVLRGKGSFKNCVEADGTSRCQKNAGGWPRIKETHRSLTLPNNPNDDDNKNGYTNLEDWLFEFSAQLE